MKKIVIAAICTMLFASPVWAQVSDSRIKTLIYDENEVYKLSTHFGYQSNIEFDKHEEIQTISVGDNSAWQIIPARRYLFVRSMQDEAHTNMTVITNKRTYQFDLRSTALSGKKESGLVYVIRFHYPDQAPAMEAVGLAPIAPAQIGMVAPRAAEPTISQLSYNYNYTLTGPNEIAPVKVFDDGIRTYMQFGSDVPVQVASYSGDGKEMPVQASKSGLYLVVDTVTDKLAIRSGDQVVKVYNEARLASVQSR